METKTKSVEDLQREASAARAELDRLTARMGEINEQIEEERQQISRDRVQAARRGEAVVHAGEKLTLDDLLHERSTLPEEHFGARIRAVASVIAVETARLEALQPELAEARHQLVPLQKQAQEAVARATAQEQKVSQLEGARSSANQRRKHQEMSLAQIERDGVKELV